MRTQAMGEFVLWAAANDSKFANAVRNATEAGFVSASLLEKELQQAGYSVNYTPGEGHGAWVEVTEGDAVVARGFSQDNADALLQAIRAELWTEELARQAAEADKTATIQ